MVDPMYGFSNGSSRTKLRSMQRKHMRNCVRAALAFIKKNPIGKCGGAVLATDLENGIRCGVGACGISGFRKRYRAETISQSVLCSRVFFVLYLARQSQPCRLVLL